MTPLDSTELMHMAIHASARGRPDDSIRALKELLDQQPENAEAHFLLAADYAEIALLDKAVSHYDQALHLNPALDLARIQFALLHTAMDNIDDAAAVLDPFLKAETATYYTDFAQGLSCLFHEDLSGTREHLIAGIERNDENAELNTDMRNLLANVEAAMGESDVANQPSTDHLLSAYSKRH